MDTRILSTSIVRGLFVLGLASIGACDGNHAGSPVQPSLVGPAGDRPGTVSAPVEPQLDSQARFNQVGQALTSCNAGPNQVAVFQQSSFGGSCNVLNLDPNRLPTGYWAPNTAGFTLSNDSVSSLKVGTGVYVTLFEDSFFAGRHASYNTGDYTSVGWMNDLTSSIRITPVERDCRKRQDGSFLPLKQGEIAIYEDNINNGDCVQWKASDILAPYAPGQAPTTFDASFELDSASSIRVGPNTTVRFCRQPFFGGYCESFNTTLWWLSKTQFGDNQLSSFLFQKF